LSVKKYQNYQNLTPQNIFGTKFGPKFDKSSAVNEMAPPSAVWHASRSAPPSSRRKNIKNGNIVAHPIGRSIKVSALYKKHINKQFWRDLEFFLLGVCQTMCLDANIFMYYSGRKQRQLNSYLRALLRHLWPNIFLVRLLGTRCALYTYGIDPIFSVQNLAP